MSYDIFKCFVLNAMCSKAKQLRNVLWHGIRPDFLEIHLLLILFPETETWVWSYTTTSRVACKDAIWDRLMAFCPFCPRRTCSSCIPTTSWWPLLRIPTATMIYSYKCYPKNSKFQTSLMKKIKLRPFKFLAAIDSIALVPLLFLSRV